jgi:hypothetical protein
MRALVPLIPALGPRSAFAASAWQHEPVRIAEFIAPAVVMALLGGPFGVLSLLCAGVVKIRRRRQRVRLSRAS